MGRPQDGSEQGAAELRTGRIRGQRVKGGPFKGQRHFPEHEQATSPSQRVPRSKDPVPLKEPSPPSGVASADNPPPGDNKNPVVFFRYDPSGQTGQKQLTDAADISGAEGIRNVILLSGNWYCDYSLDAGVTWKRKDPTKVFPNLAGGFCCDQVVTYVSSIDRWVWLLQYQKDANGGAFRLAVASTAGIRKNFDTAWTYWDFRTTNFGEGTGNDMDYPDLSFSDQFLFLSTDMQSSVGRLVARIPLKDLASGGTINFGYVDPSQIQNCWGDHLVQSSTDGAYWVGHVDNSTLQIFSMPDASNTVTWKQVKVHAWPQGTLSSKGPNGNDWLAKENSFPEYAVIGGTRLGNRLWLAWTASPGNDGKGGFKFSNTHVRVAEVDLGTYTTTSEMQIWNPDYAFAYPSLAHNARGEIAVILGWGGKNDNADAAMGIIGDYVVWYQNGSTMTTQRWGDYVTVRPSQRNEGMFSGFGYYTVKDNNDTTKAYYDPYYVLFGRSSLGGP